MGLGLAFKLVGSLVAYDRCRIVGAPFIIMHDPFVLAGLYGSLRYTSSTVVPAGTSCHLSFYQFDSSTCCRIDESFYARQRVELRLPHLSS